MRWEPKPSKDGWYVHLSTEHENRLSFVPIKNQGGKPMHFSGNYVSSLTVTGKWLGPIHDLYDVTVRQR